MAGEPDGIGPCVIHYKPKTVGAPLLLSLSEQRRTYPNQSYPEGAGAKTAKATSCFCRRKPDGPVEGSADRGCGERKSVVTGKSVAVRVSLGGRGAIKKKKL